MVTHAVEKTNSTSGCLSLGAVLALLLIAADGGTLRVHSQGCGVDPACLAEQSQVRWLASVMAVAARDLLTSGTVYPAPQRVSPLLREVRSSVALLPGTGDLVQGEQMLLDHYLDLPPPA